MTNRKEANLLGSYVMMILLNNKMYKSGRITKDMQKKISAEIMAEYERIRSV